MIDAKKVVLGTLAVLVTGCSTVREADRAQEEVAARGSEAGVQGAAAKVDFRRTSLASLVAFAATNRPSLVAKRLAVDDARLALKELAADAPLASETPWTAPRLTLDGSYGESSPGTTFNGGRWQTSGDPSVGLSLDLLIWDFGRYDARAKAQSEAVIAAELSLVDEGFTVFKEVAAGYFNFFEKRALFEVARTNEQQYAAHLSRAEERYAAGEAFLLDVLKARLDLANAHQVTVSCSNDVATSGATLMNALGVDAAHGTCDEAFGTDPVGIDRAYRAFARTTTDVGELFSFARTNSPTVRTVRARLRGASHDVDYAVRDLLPNVSASASLNWTDPLWVWKWGFSGVQTLFKGFSKVTAVDRAVVAMRAAASAVDEAEQALSLKIETAVAVRDTSEEAIRSALASVKSASENLATVREQFAVGEASRIDLSDAISADSQARGDCLSAFYDSQRAEAALFAVIGVYPTYREEIVRGDVK